MVFEAVKLTDIKIPKISLAQWLFQTFRTHAAQGKTALVWADKGTELTYANLLLDAVRVATALKAKGLKSGDTIAIVARNSPELFPFVIGCIFADIKFVPSVPELKESELKSNFLIINPDFILTQPEKVQVIKEAISEFNPRPEIILLEETVFKDILTKGSDASPDTFQPAKIEDPDNHVFAYMFSSGTTGKQKAIMMSDYPIISSTALRAAPYFKNKGLFYCTSQIFWNSWFIHLIRTTISGRTWLFQTNTDLESILQAIHKYKPTDSIFAPNLFYAIRNAIEKYPGRWDISSIKFVLTAGDWFGSKVQKQLSEQLKWNIYQEYGSTETGVISISDVKSPPVYGSAGKPVVPIKLVDVNTGKEITERNQIGEIRTKSVIMAGYVGNAASTAEAFDESGWFKTGDLGYISQRNDVFIVDRIKEMLKYKGFQVTPNELEEIIRLIPGVAETAVAGKKDEVAGSLLTAFVVKKPGSNLTENDIKNFMDNRDLHDSKKLRGGVIFVDELPKNSNGKILRRKLADLLNGTHITKTAVS